MSYRFGDKVGFAEERNRYKVWAAGERFLICVRFLFGDLIYTVVDLEKQVRGPEDLIFPRRLVSFQEAEQMLARLENGDSAVSRRHGLPLKWKTKT